MVKEQKLERDKAIESGLKEATLVPFRVLEESVEALELAKDVVINGNKNSLSDAGVAGLTAQTAAEGAYYNVKINLPDIQDEAFKSKTAAEAKGMKEKAVKLGNEIRKILEKELK